MASAPAISAARGAGRPPMNRPETSTPTPAVPAADLAAEPPTPAAGPVDADWAEREAAARGQPPAHEDGALESLGKAISDPVRTAADETPETPPDGA